MKEEIKPEKFLEAIGLILVAIFTIGYIGTIVFIFAEKGALCGFVSMLISSFIGLFALVRAVNNSPNFDWDDW